ncbi:hypothetical protein FRC17_006862, partial [Serendipita sp. 399]
MPNNITPPPSPRSSRPVASTTASKDQAKSATAYSYNGITTTDPPKVNKIPTHSPNYQTRWEREKAKAKAEGVDMEVGDPKMIGPWILGEMLGKGASGKSPPSTTRMAAVKILNVQAAGMAGSAPPSKEKSKSEKMLLSAEREIAVMKLLDHPNIMKMYDVWSSPKELFLVLEYVEGGELFDYLCSRGSRLHVVEAVSIIKQVLAGVYYCHSFNICHRDLKPENILLTTPTNGSDQTKRIKIADFGMSAIDSLNGLLRTSCGSPHYASPEIVRGQTYHGASSDIWSCGVILFALLTSRLPFDDPNVNIVLRKVRDGRFTVPDWVMPEAKDLLVRMLEVDIDKRISVILSFRMVSSAKITPPQMPDIFNHPLLQIATPGIILPPVPKVDEYALPVLPSDLDPDLLRSLCIILREKDKHVVVERLCCREKNFEKAFYSLLCRYRDRSFEEYNMEHRLSSPSFPYSSTALVTPPTTPIYDVPLPGGEYPFKRHFPGRASPLPSRKIENTPIKTNQFVDLKLPRHENGRSKITNPTAFGVSSPSPRTSRTFTEGGPKASRHAVQHLTNTSKGSMASRHRSDSAASRRSKASNTADGDVVATRRISRPPTTPDRQGARKRLSANSPNLSPSKAPTGGFLGDRRLEGQIASKIQDATPL